jgi:DNA-binding protein HU-beta
MTKQEIIEKISTDAGITKDAAGKAVSTFLNSITETLAEGGEVKFIGFGTFSVSERSARPGRNPQTGKEMQIEAKNSPKFTAGKPLKDAVAKGKK